MNSFRNILIAVTACIGFVAAPSFVSAQSGNTSTNTVKIDVLVNETAFAAIEEAAKQAASAVLTGKHYTVPLSALKGAATHIAMLRLGRWLNCVHICQQFQIWALSSKRTPPFSGDPAFDVNINLVDASGTVLMVATVPYFAKCNSINSKGQAVGYVAPINSKGGATMKLDVFGGGEVILERIECPCP